MFVSYFRSNYDGPRTKVFAITSTSSALLDESGKAAIENAVLLSLQTKFINENGREIQKPTKSLSVRVLFRFSVLQGFFLRFFGF